MKTIIFLAATLFTGCATVSPHDAMQADVDQTVYSYSRTQGFFAGVSLEGTGIGTRDDVNAAYYGTPVTAAEILSGKVQPPAGARALSAVLAKY